MKGWNSSGSKSISVRSACSGMMRFTYSVVIVPAPRAQSLTRFVISVASQSLIGSDSIEKSSRLHEHTHVSPFTILSLLECIPYSILLIPKFLLRELDKLANINGEQALP
ncbi:hypothetical protein PENTCL1PPCAC_21706 [Pristionchus entomophagus]|uniref:G protein-coupled receptor n=1 Tax=Pristionchus entomophagus TaxID=358040 RepID=A0AAV5TZB1_9BILA|nr:hypothetical protein PENTCL1PPCAC_21706 [Pristionchus entomophagus]